MKDGAAKEARGIGHKTLTTLSKLIKKTSETLINWYHENRFLFDAVNLGSICLKKSEEDGGNTYIKVDSMKNHDILLVSKIKKGNDDEK